MSTATERYIACHTTHDQHGTVAVVHADHRGVRLTRIPSEASASSAHEPPHWFVGVNPQGLVLLMDPLSKEIYRRAALPPAAYPAYAYPEPDGGHLWFTNDGDKDGNDELNCGKNGASVTVISRSGTPLGEQGVVLKTLCVGRGHHVAAFSAPSPLHPQIPRRAFLTNLMDGTLSIVGNDPNHPQDYLALLATLNLCDPTKETHGEMRAPNNAAPHGMVYSPLTGKVYNLNNGYGSIVVIDPLTLALENTIAMPYSSNLLLSPCGRFLIGKGVDRKTDPHHVIGKVSVVDTQINAGVTMLDLPDFYPSTYRFSPDGRKLYITSAATGNAQQKSTLKINVLRVYDATRLPELVLIHEVSIGMADCGRRPLAFLEITPHLRYVLIPNPTDGTLCVLNADSDQVVDTLTIAAPGATEVLFSFWSEGSRGC